MQIFRNESERSYESGLPDVSSRDPYVENAMLIGYRSPFEVLGESIVPGLTTVPAIFQGTFVQITNLDNKATVPYLLAYAPTKAFNFGPSAQNVTLNANFIDGDLDVFNFTADFKKSSLPFIKIPPQKTFIVGIQYAIIPKVGADSTAPEPVGPEALGNRGFINVLTPAPSLITTTIRQVFVKSLSDPTTIISATAYSVPVSAVEVATPPSEFLSLLHTP